MDEDKLNGLYGDKLGKKVLLRKKSYPNYVVVGKLDSIIGTKLIVKGNKDEYHVDYDDILSLDLKGKEEFTEGSK